jgi:hypothetical protein
VLLVAHWCRETGCGDDELNWNVGKVRAFASTREPWYYDPRTGLPWRAYDDEPAGVRGGLDVIRRGARYVDAWAKLRAGDVTWYTALGEGGYYSDRALTAEQLARHQADYESILATVERCA